MWSVRSRTFSFIPESAGLNEIFLTYGPAWTREGGGLQGCLDPGAAAPSMPIALACWWRVPGPQTPHPSPCSWTSAVDTCCSVLVIETNMLGIYCLCFQFVSKLFSVMTAKNHARSVLFIVLNCNQLFLMLSGVAFLHVYFTENMFKHKTNRQLHSWVELQYGIIFQFNLCNSLFWIYFLMNDAFFFPLVLCLKPSHRMQF